MDKAHSDTTQIGHNGVQLSKDHFSIQPDHVLFQSPQALKVLSSAVHNAGFGLYKTFVNRHVDKDYFCDDVQQEMATYLEKQGYSLVETVAMMTAVQAEHVEIGQYEWHNSSVVIAVTAGVGNAVDVSKAISRDEEYRIGTINTWIFVNGHLADAAFIQAMITATEAKAKAMQDEKVVDPLTNTIATGTSTDSVLVAATQYGEYEPYAGPITAIGKCIGCGVYDCTLRAIQAYKKAKGWTA